MAATMAHIPVLLSEAVDGLNVRPEGIYVDGTFGRGGHSREILRRLGPGGRLVGIDRDPEAVKAGKALEAEDSRFTIVHSRFSRIAEVTESLGIKGSVDGILLDLGVSSPQLDEADRGFSFDHDGPLDMRMDPTEGVPASEWLNTASVSEIASVLRDFGEERFALKMAKAIVSDRAEKPFLRTSDLAGLAARVIPTREKGRNPATRTFQGIRIYINSELEEVRLALESSVSVLRAGGRLAVISFHSLEDRIVKQFIRRMEQGGSKKKDIPFGLPVRNDELKSEPLMRRIGSFIKPSEAECERNPRARSSVLRIAERTAASPDAEKTDSPDKEGNR